MSYFANSVSAHIFLNENIFSNVKYTLPEISFVILHKNKAIIKAFYASKPNKISSPKCNFIRHPLEINTRDFALRQSQTVD